MATEEPFAKLETTLYEVTAPKDDSISTKSMAKAIDEAISSHYSAPPRVECVSSFAKGSQDLGLRHFLKSSMLNLTNNKKGILFYGPFEQTKPKTRCKLQAPLFSRSKRPLSRNAPKETYECCSRRQRKSNIYPNDLTGIEDVSTHKFWTFKQKRQKKKRFKAL